jgi:hypothetical protein
MADARQGCALHERRAFIPDSATSAGTADPPAPLFARAERLGGQRHAAPGFWCSMTLSDRHPCI